MKVYQLLCVCLIFSLSRINAQVNLQSGAAEFSMPLFSYANPKSRLATGITLSYAAGNGLKVDDIGPYVGAGWSLNFGGQIQRIQHGEPDDQKQDQVFSYPTDINGYFTYVAQYYPNGYMYSEFNPAQLVDDGGGFIPQKKPFIEGHEYKPNPVYLADREQDVFAFVFNGRTGRFIIGRDGTIKTLEDSKLKIFKSVSDMTSSGIITRINEFVILDEMGIKYVFRDFELSEKMVYDSPFDPNSTITVTVPQQGQSQSTYALYKGNPTGKFVIQKWLLSEIVNPLSGEKISFNYENYSIDMQGHKFANFSETGTKKDVSFTVERIKGAGKRLQNIHLSAKETVEFVYSSEARKDLPNDKSLNRINIQHEGTNVYGWDFNYGYFVKGAIKSVNSVFTQDEIYQSRLCLLSVQKTDQTGTVKEPPTKFDYFVGEIPTDVGAGQTANFNYEVSPLFSFYTDHWGYSMYSPGYAMNNPSLSEPRNDISPNTIPWNTVVAFTKNLGPLAPLINGVAPTYRDNFDPYYSSSFASLAGTLRGVKNSYGGYMAYVFERNKFKGPAMTTEIVVGGHRVKSTSLYDGISHANDIIKEYKYTKTNGESSGWGHEIFNYKNTVTNRIYKCSGGTAAKIKKEFSSVLGTTAFKLTVSGVGFSPKAFKNLKPNEQKALAPNGYLFSFNILFTIVKEIFSTGYKDFTTDNFSTTSNNEGNDLPFLYSRVEVIDRIGVSTNGKTVFEFTSDQDYPIDVPSLTVPNSNKPRYAPWIYGLPKSISIYDATGRLKKRTENTYNIFKSTTIDNNNVSQKWRPVKFTLACQFLYTNSTTTGDIIHDIYYPMTGRAELVQTKEFVYNDNNDYSVATTNISYSPYNYLPVKKVSSNSRGETIESYSYYPQDYSISGAIQRLKDNNMLNVPISTQTFIVKSDGIKYLISGSVSEYGTISNNDIKIIKIHEFKSEKPITQTSVAFSNSLLIPNSTFYKEMGAVTYDSKGDIIESSSPKGISSMIYDGESVIATVANSAFSNIAYTSFESNNSGNWNIYAGSTFITDRFLTGKRSFSGTLQKYVNPSVKYKITLWSMTWSNNYVNGQPGILVTTLGDWKLYEWDVANVNSVVVSGDNIDEVRLYPVNARMTTCTYEPMVGKTSECDASNRIIYYEYDALGRQRTVRDEKRNIIKTFEYNYKQ